MDASGLLTKRQNGNGETTEVERDAAGRALRKRFSDGGLTEWQYDAAGEVAHAVCDGVSLQFDRDEFGRVARETQGARSVESRYDERGLRTERVTSSGNALRWRYDANGRVERLQLPGEEMLAFVRDAVGRETERRLGGGLVIKQEFDALDRIVSQWAGLEAAGSRSLSAVAERQYRYDEGGRPAEIRDGRWGATKYSYDPDGRIAGAEKERGASEAFTYDLVGNIASALAEANEPAVAPRFSSNLRMRFYGKDGRLERIGDTRYEYDRDGRVVEKREGGQRWQYEWNVEGKLIALRTPEGERWTYAYDAYGRRVSKQGPGGKTEYLWDGATVAEEISGGTRTATWVFEPGTFRPVAKQENGKTYACVTDQIGTPRELVSGSGEVGWSARFRVWGEVEGRAEAKTECPLRFQGQWFDEESGLAYNWNRYYDSRSGGYLASDPIGLEGGTRSSGYVHNPLSWVDPFGLAGCSPTLLPHEGEVGTYGDLSASGTRGDNITAHHMPSDSYMKGTVPGYTRDEGIAMNMEQPTPGAGGRHRLTSSYGTSPDLSVSPRDALAGDVSNARSIYQSQGLYNSDMRGSLQDVIAQNKAAWPGTFDKPPKVP